MKALRRCMLLAAIACVPALAIGADPPRERTGEEDLHLVFPVGGFRLCSIM